MVRVQGVTDTFDDFARRELPGLLRLGGVLAGDRGIAEDVVQEVLLRISRRWESIRGTDVPAAYVRRMVVNEYLSWRRKWARIVLRSDVIDDRVVPDHAERHVERDDLNRRLDRLPPKQRAVLVLRYYEGLADAAVAELLGCSTGTVRSHASRALATLRIDLHDAAGSEDGPAVPLAAVSRKDR